MCVYIYIYTFLFHVSHRGNKGKDRTRTMTMMGRMPGSRQEVSKEDECVTFCIFSLWDASTKLTKMYKSSVDIETATANMMTKPKLRTNPRLNLCILILHSEINCPNCMKWSLFSYCNAYLCKKKNKKICSSLFHRLISSSSNLLNLLFYFIVIIIFFKFSAFSRVIFSILWLCFWLMSL